jgi:alanine dehydrogenase
MPQALVIDSDAVFASVSPEEAIEHVAAGFVSFTRGDWEMPAKVYLQSPPNGDFRAMPARGEGLAILKWVTSFPPNPSRGLPAVIGVILVSDASDGRWLALVDGTAVTALRTGAAAAVATRALARGDARTAGIVGCGLHGSWAARCLQTLGFGDGVCSDRDEDAARRLASELGWRAAGVEDALACDVVTTVTPGHEPVVAGSHLRPGMHVNAMGADGPGKSEVEIDAITSCRLFCDEWTQASHGGELTGAVQRGLITKEGVVELGSVLAGDDPGRTADDEITLFDSTGLAIQDLAIVVALMAKQGAGELKSAKISL